MFFLSYILNAIFITIIIKDNNKGRTNKYPLFFFLSFYRKIYTNIVTIHSYCMLIDKIYIHINCILFKLYFCLNYKMNWNQNDKLNAWINKEKCNSLALTEHDIQVKIMIIRTFTDNHWHSKNMKIFNIFGINSISVIHFFKFFFLLYYYFILYML